MIDDILKYLAALRKYRAQALTALTSLAGGIVARFFGQPVPSGVLFTLAVCAFVWAGFRVWQEEYQLNNRRPRPTVRLAVRGTFLVLEIKADVQAEYLAQVDVVDVLGYGPTMGHGIWHDSNIADWITLGAGATARLRLAQRFQPGRFVDPESSDEISLPVQWRAFFQAAPAAPPNIIADRSLTLAVTILTRPEPPIPKTVNVALLREGTALFEGQQVAPPLVRGKDWDDPER